MKGREGQLKLFSLLVVLCGAVLAARGQDTYKPASAFDWKIAQRLDSGRVVIMLTDEDAVITSAERDALEPVMPKPAKEFLAVFLEGVRPLSAEIGRRLTKNTVTPGDRWAIDAGRGGWFETSVDGFVLAGAGCSETTAVMASIDADKAAAFSSVKEKYFPARAMSGWAPAAKNTSVGPTSTATAWLKSWCSTTTTKASRSKPRSTRPRARAAPRSSRNSAPAVSKLRE